MATKKTGSTLQAINAQIAALQAKADAIRKQEIAGVISKIKEAITHYSLTAEDLGLAASAPRKTKAVKVPTPGRKPGRKAAVTAPKGKTARPAKYADGQGRTWGGMGKRPEWFKAALAAGKSPEDLLVKA